MGNQVGTGEGETYGAEGVGVIREGGGTREAGGIKRGQGVKLALEESSGMRGNQVG